MLEGNGWLVEVCGPRAAAAHGHACLLMMDCDGRVCVAASDPMTVLQSWVRGWYLCLGAAAHRSTSIAALIGHRRQRQRLRQRQHQQQRQLRRVWTAGRELAVCVPVLYMSHVRVHGV